MKNRILAWEIGGFLFIGISGAFFHFLFEWSGFSRVVAIFAAVNESTWEHLKMVFWPGVMFALLEYAFLKNHARNFLAAKAAALFSAPFLIAVTWFIYTAFTGRSILWLDLTLFYLSILAGQALSHRLLTAPALRPMLQYLSGAVLALLLLAFLTFTYFPPRLAVFEHRYLRHTGQYGILETYEE